MGVDMQYTNMSMKHGMHSIILEPVKCVAFAMNQPGAVRMMRYIVKMVLGHYVKNAVMNQTNTNTKYNKPIQPTAKRRGG